jgi:hypothetical protein
VIGVDGDGGMHGRAVSHGECRWGWWSCLGDAVPLVHSDPCGGILVSDAGWVTMVFTFGRVSGVRPSFPPS